MNAPILSPVGGSAPGASHASHAALMTATLLDAVGGLARGAQFQLSLAPGDTRITEEIDTFLAGFRAPGFRADEACPIVLADNDFDTFRLFGANNAFKQVNVLASKESDINEVDPESSTDTYRVIERALGAFVSATTESQASYNVREASARRIRQALDLDREVRIFGATGLLSSSTGWAAANVETIAGGSEWTVVTIDPLLDIQQRILASAQPVTDIWMNEEAGFTFLRNPFVRDHMRQMLGDNAPPAPTADASGRRNQSVQDFMIPGLPPFHIVPGRVLNETTGVLDPILTDNVILTCNPGIPTTGDDIITAVTWRRRGISGTGFTTREFELPKRGLESGMMMVSGHAEDPKFISNTCGGLIKNVLP